MALSHQWHLLVLSNVRLDLMQTTHLKGVTTLPFKDTVLGKLHRIRRGPWGIQTWQINTIHNIGLYGPVLQIKKQQSHFMRKNWSKSLTLQCYTMTTHKFGGELCTKVCSCGEKLSCTPQKGLWVYCLCKMYCSNFFVVLQTNTLKDLWRWHVHSRQMNLGKSLHYLKLRIK